MTTPAVAHTAEFQRIASLPRRVWRAEDLDFLAVELTEILRAPGGSMKLRPAQALAIHDAGVHGGAFIPLGVGDGKTIPSMLIPLVLRAERPLLLLPGGLVENAQRARRDLAKHWRIPTSLRIMSYDFLSRAPPVGEQNELESYRPDLIIADEAHRLKNKHAAVTRKVARYMHAWPLTRFVALSGSFMDTSLKDYAHILIWCMKLGAPAPTNTEEIDEWAAALDEFVDPLARRPPGALLEFSTQEERATLSPHIAARRGFQRRLNETPGVVATIGEGEHVGASIYLRSRTYDVKPVTDQHIARVRSEWITPDGWELLFAPEKWAHVCAMALGLYYRWDPRPPREWLDARRAWNSFIREIIAHGRTYDSDKHVRDAIDAGALKPRERQALGAELLATWRAIEPTFTPNVVPEWFDDSALHAVAKWMKHPGLVWTEHTFFAERLAKLTGARYFGAGGFDAAGAYIEDASPKECVIASLDANREGKNLQAIWHRCLFVGVPSRATWYEQGIARFHRPGQRADVVEVDVLLGCRENFDAIQTALAGAGAIHDTTGKKQKLLIADVVLPAEHEVNAWHTPRWSK